MTVAFARAEPQKAAPPPRRVSQPHDRDEREAERAADVVARGGSVAGWSFSSVAPSSGDAPVRRCAGPGKCGCPACKARVDDVVGRRGAALDPGTRSFMERGFGHDFGSVRLHADSGAAASARSLGARAYTVSNDVVTAEGAPHVGSDSSRRLIAHELAHVVQDRAAPGANVVRRQAAPRGAAPAPAPAPPARPQREERLGVGRGGGRIDAELDRSASLLTARVKVLFNFVNNPRPWPSPARQTAWRDAFIRAVQQRWSFKHFLAPERECPGEPQQVAVRLQVIPVTSSPHFTMSVGFTDRFQQSFVQGKTAQMDVLDIAQRSDQPQTPAEHEFGHMLGLPHIHCDSNDGECYGTTSEERADVMGKGSFVSPRDYGPFAELMPYFTGCNYRVVPRSVVPSGRGPVIGGFLGGLLGGVGGALLGSLLGPVGAILGGILGAVGGAALGAHVGTPDVPS